MEKTLERCKKCREYAQCVSAQALRFNDMSDCQDVAPCQPWFDVYGKDLPLPLGHSDQGQEQPT